MKKVNTLRLAITREVSPSIGDCELSHLARVPIDLDMARAQHRQYEECLAALGCRIHRLPAEPGLPDAVFVEDTAVVLDELAIITRPGAVSRRGETEAPAKALRAYRRVAAVEPPGTLDGGDVLRIGKRLLVGLSSRSNEAGVEQLGRLARPFGYSVDSVQVKGCLHLKSAVTQVAESTLLINRDWVDSGAFEGLELVDVDPGEPFGGNALLVGDTVIYPASYPATRRRLEERGIGVKVVDVAELGKAEGGVTCCSLIFDA
jgi:dimethylargininase